MYSASRVTEIRAAMLAFGVSVVLGAAGAASAAVTTLSQWNLGDQDVGGGSGTAGAVAESPTVDSVGSLDLPRFGAPTYINTGTTQLLGVNFDNPGPTHSVPASDYFSDPSAVVNLSSTTNWGVEAWVRLANDPGANETAVLHFGFSTGGANQFILQSLGGVWVVHIPGIAIFTGGGTVADAVGEWTHLAVLSNAGVFEMYVDGVQVAPAAAFFLSVTSITGVEIAASQNGAATTRGWDGDIAVVRLFEFAPGQFNTSDFLSIIPSPAALPAGGLLLAAMMTRRRPAAARR